jgi:hypothetical protein
MSTKKCPKCGSEGIVLAPSGEVLSCSGCDKRASETKVIEERAARKDEIDKSALSIAARSTTKDALDLGSKIAGVLVASAALFKANKKAENAADQYQVPLNHVVVERFCGDEYIEDDMDDNSSQKRLSLTLSTRSAEELEGMSCDAGLTITEATNMALGLFKCVFEEKRKGNKVIIASHSGTPICEIVVPWF